jgi:hypothetical protein
MPLYILQVTAARNMNALFIVLRAFPCMFPDSLECKSSPLLLFGSAHPTQTRDNACSGSQLHLVRDDRLALQTFATMKPDATSDGRRRHFHIWMNSNFKMSIVGNTKLEFRRKLSAISSVNIHPNKQVYDYDSP